MAKKGQKHRSYPRELKEEILRKYFEENMPAGVLAKEYGVPSNTIETWVYKKKQGVDVLVDHRQYHSGRPKKNPSDVDYQERYEILKKYLAFLKAQRERK